MGPQPILVLGRDGQLGQTLHALGDARLHFYSRAQCDVTDKASLGKAFAAQDWVAAINATAFTDVDGAQSAREAAHAVNVEAPGQMARLAALSGIPLIHVSTDYVFDGAKAMAYDEDDRVNPIGVYGATKAAGEAAIRASGARYAIVRTAWLQSRFGSNFIGKINRLAGERDDLHVIADQFGSPTSAQDLADALLIIASRMTAEPALPSGTWHFVNSGRASWFDLAELVLQARAEVGLSVPRLIAVSASEWPGPVVRPANSQLATTRISRDFKLAPNNWQEAVLTLMPHILATATR